jgi:lipid-A-disaccharide synthase-like uncharacterized protein
MLTILADGYFDKFRSELASPLVLFGMLGQAVFMFRFVVQWYVSERLGRVTVPIAFWYISIVGALMTLVYAVQKPELVLLFSQSLGLVIYARNLMLIHRERSRIAAAAVGAEKKMEGLAVAREEPSI